MGQAEIEQNRLDGRNVTAYKNGMEQSPTSILLFIKENHALAASLAEKIEAWFAARNIPCQCFSPRATTQDFAHCPLSQRPLALVLGGDGTMLSVARVLCGKNIPLLGINLGKVGFLAEIDPSEWEQALERVMAGNHYHVQPYMALAWTLLRNNTPFASGVAINDVVLARGAIARAVTLDVSINKVFMTHLKCDGIMVSAPLGTTAYAVSAGGPLVFPSLEAQILTPISPFAGALAPFVLPASSEFCIKASRGTNQSAPHLTVDGQESYPMQEEDELIVTGVPGALSLLLSDANWYLTRLIERGFVVPGPAA